MNGASLRSLLPLLLAAAVLSACWWALWFLCDDAFIAFRYVGNLYDGRGLVWNPPPWAPVEGYTCFLWVAVMYVVWVLTGVAPPTSSNPLALVCALGTLWLVARHLARLAMPAAAERWRPWLTTLALCGIASNHTFATWASSGLETAMFGLWAVGWTLHAMANRSAWRATDFAGLSTWAALAMLTRPDGGLLALATLAIVGHAVGTRAVSWRGATAGLAPLLLPALHVAWRRWYYGEWLPNTYYAKVVEAWPESGWRYLYCFLVEHGMWLWLLLAGAWLVRAASGRGAWRSLFGARCPAAVAAASWLAFVGYYTLVVGGDHFAYRPFVPLVVLAFAGFGAMSLRVLSPRFAVLLLAAFGGSANWFPWWYEAALRGREADGFVRASTTLPAPLGDLYRSWDRCQAWLRLRYVALPRGLHAVTCQHLLALLPERRPGQVEGLAPGDRGVFRTVAAGVVSWSLPDVDIVDAVGLSDWVVARSKRVAEPVKFAAGASEAMFPAFDVDRDGRLTASEIVAIAGAAGLSNQTGVIVQPAAWADLLLAICDRDGDGLDQQEFLAAVGELQNSRHMVHERMPPEGYVEALRPNVVLDGQRFRVVPGVSPPTDAEIREVEARYRAMARR